MILQFTGKKHEADNIWSFNFIPKEPFTWQAGQSLRLEIPGPYGGIEHRFSISSAPSSGQITITTRLSGSEYKNSLNQLIPGVEVAGYGLEGAFTWPAAPHPICIAAGIGITPFHAMFAERLHHNLPLQATLFYSNSNEQAAFLEVLQQWQAYGLILHFLPSTRIAVSDIITNEPNYCLKNILISGSSAMVNEISTGLLQAGADKTHLYADHFTGRVDAAG